MISSTITHANERCRKRLLPRRLKLVLASLLMVSVSTGPAQVSPQCSPFSIRPTNLPAGVTFSQGANTFSASTAVSVPYFRLGQRSAGTFFQANVVPAADYGYLPPDATLTISGSLDLLACRVAIPLGPSPKYERMASAM